MTQHAARTTTGTTSPAAVGKSPSTNRGTRRPISAAEFQAHQQGQAGPPTKVTLRRYIPLDNTLQAAANEIKALEEECTRSEIGNRYQIGEVVLRIETDARYGQKGVSRLARAIGRDRSTLYRAARIVQQWPPPALSDLTSQAGSEQLSWSHLEVLTTVADDEHRRKLAQRAITEQLGVRELRREVDTRSPRDQARRANQQGRTIREVSAAAAAAQDRLERALTGLSATPRSATTAEDLDDAVERLGTLAEAVERVRQALVAFKDATNDGTKPGQHGQAKKNRRRPARLLGRHHNPLAPAPPPKSDPQ